MNLKNDSYILQICSVCGEDDVVGRGGDGFSTLLSELSDAFVEVAYYLGTIQCVKTLHYGVSSAEEVDGKILHRLRRTNPRRGNGKTRVRRRGLTLFA